MGLPIKYNKKESIILTDWKQSKLMYKITIDSTKAFDHMKPIIFKQQNILKVIIILWDVDWLCNLGPPKQGSLSGPTLYAMNLDTYDITERLGYWEILPI